MRAAEGGNARWSFEQAIKWASRSNACQAGERARRAVRGASLVALTAFLLDDRSKGAYCIRRSN